MELISTRRMVENGVVYRKGDVILHEFIPHDRLVFLLAREFVLPVGGWDALDEPLFTDVMEKRD